MSLAILIKFYNRDSKYYSGLLFLLLAGSIIMDLLWMIIVLPNWGDDESHSPSWKSLGFVHSLAGFLSFCEVIVKGVQLFFLFNKGALNNLKFKNDSGVYYIK